MSAPTAAVVDGGPVAVRWLELPFPLRPDFTATLIIPRDLTSAEAERIAAFINALTLPNDSEVEQEEAL